jgi:hypothetical protein
MIVNFILNLLVGILNILFGWLPTITTLPTIIGFDIDSALVTGMGQLNTVITSVWVLGYLMQGFLFIMGYYIIKMTLRFFLGSRAPSHS